MYAEKGNLEIRSLDGKSEIFLVEALLHIITKLINTDNAQSVQVIDEDSSRNLISNDISRIVTKLQIKSAVYFAFIRPTILDSSRIPFYSTFQAFLLCSLMRDIHTYEVSLKDIVTAEEILYREMKSLKETVHSNSIERAGFASMFEYPNLMQQIHDRVVIQKRKGRKSQIGDGTAFVENRMKLEFTRTNRRNPDDEEHGLSVHFSSYILEISERNRIHGAAQFDRRILEIEAVFLCDCIVERDDILRLLRNQKQFNNNSKILVLSTAVLSDQEIDYFYESDRILLVCNVGLKVIREMSFVFGLPVIQGPQDLKQINQTSSRGQYRKMKLRLLEYNEIGLLRSSSELFHLKDRMNLLISEEEGEEEEVVYSKSNTEQHGVIEQESRGMISIVIAIPSPFANRFLDVAARIKKQIEKLRWLILSGWKVVKGSGRFEQALSQQLFDQYRKNEGSGFNKKYLFVLAQIFADYFGYLKKNECGADGKSQCSFYDSYSMKKKILLKVHAILKARAMTQLEINYKVKQNKKIHQESA